MNHPLSSLFSYCRNASHQIQDDSRKVKKGDLFIALKGRTHDGHLFIDSACKNGAEALVVEDQTRIPENFKGSVYKVESTNKILSHLLNQYYDFPSKKMFCVGITGTNGKTTVSYMVEKIFNSGGWKTGVIGTIDHHINGQSWPSRLTTPAPVELYQRLNQFLKLSAQALVMEVSSIGLDQNRVDGVDFNTAVFTNLTQDHLDYHKDMEDYFKAKKSFFERTDGNSGKQRSTAVLNKDDPYSSQCITNCKMPFISYGAKGGDLCYKIISQSLKGMELEVMFQGKICPLYLPMMGEHNASNATASLAVAVTAGFSLEKACRALESFEGVKGRLQRVPSQEPFFVFVDYAHTPSALRAALWSLVQVKKKEKKIITVFGCGGGRDQGKREKMARVVEEFSNSIVVTSDNPRNEDPEKIIQDIVKGFQTKNIFQYVDRKTAIQKGLELAEPGDIVLIAGKGHESTQEIGSQSMVWDDFEETQKLLS